MRCNMDKVAQTLNGPDSQPPRNNKEKISDSKENSTLTNPSKSTESQKGGSGARTTSTEGISLPPSLMKALRRKASSVGIGSSSSNGGGSGNNSDNSGLVSLGNNSFGFNFDSEDGMLNNSPQTSDGDPKTTESDSDGNGTDKNKLSRNNKTEAMCPGQKLSKPRVQFSGGRTSDSAQGSDAGGDKSTVSSLTTSSQGSGSKSSGGSSHEIAAAAAVANLQSIIAENNKEESTSKTMSGSKRKAGEDEDPGDDSGGYNSDDEGATSRPKGVAGSGNKSSHIPDSSPSSPFGPIASGKPRETLPNQNNKAKKTKYLDEQKREERNAREKERSFRISRQINELRNLLSSGGVIVPKGTKSSVLTEAANYIRMLQQHQYRSEIDRHQLIQQMQMIGGGALGPQAATAVRHVAAQNGVWSLGNFGGVPPKSAMRYYQQGTPETASSGNSEEQKQPSESPLVTSIEEHDYRFVFNSCAVGMAIASMGGAFIDCNQLFCQLSNYTKQEVCAMTIFNLTSRQDLQHAFDLISQMISPPSDARTQAGSKPCALRGSMKNRDDLGLSVSLIKGEDGIAKCFCVTLVKNPSSPFDSSGLVPATADLIQNPTESIIQGQKSSESADLEATPAYTAG